MRLRLHGTPSEMAATLTALAEVLEIRAISRLCPGRPSSTLERIYLESVPHNDMEEK